jgi:hypothetical protein
VAALGGAGLAAMHQSMRQLDRQRIVLVDFTRCADINIQ